MPKIRLHHVRALFWTYLVWAFLNLWYAERIRNAVHAPVEKIPYFWALLHIVPLWVVWSGSVFAFFALYGVVGGLSLIVAGLLIEGSWARFLIIVGISSWFLVAWFLLGIAV